MTYPIYLVVEMISTINKAPFTVQSCGKDPEIRKELLVTEFP
jgi:hypothetical protein